MVINSVQSSLLTNGSDLASKTLSEDNTESFEQQLSSAVAQSLKALGIAGEVNVKISKTTDGNTSQQISVNYSGDPSVKTGTSVGNPFSGPYVPYVAPSAAATEKPVLHDWAPYYGPRDTRDEIPGGTGSVSASGSPQIALNEKAAANQYGYTGEAARNPYFTSPSNPLRPGYVLGFQNWFQEGMILGGVTGPMPANKIMNSTADGAQEALRLVQQYAPDAQLTKKVWGSDGGPFAASAPTWSVQLSDGRTINAGSLLNSYYNQGYGVTIYSDDSLRHTLGLA